jgi:bifunctional UDP-N-acetylglucosamine pyrophosphorylase/glucosamine-1-phosphate N-acetyltransferase
LDLTVIVLKPGQGAGLTSSLPTMTHPLAGRPIVRFVIDAAHALEPANLVVVGNDDEQVRRAVGAEPTYVTWAGQQGTARAVLQAESAMTGRAGTVLVLHADLPLIRSTTLYEMVLHHQAERATMTLVRFRPEEPARHNRVVLDPETGRVLGTAKAQEPMPDGQATDHVHSGFLCFRDDWLWPSLARHRSQAGDEARPIDLMALALKQGETVATLPVADPLEVVEVDNRLKLAQAESGMRRRINEQWMWSGVTLVHAEATYIEAGVEIGADTVIWPNTFLQGLTRIGRGCTIGPGSVIRDSAIGDGCRVELSVVEQAIMEEGSDVGPFGHLRKGAHLGPGAHMGNFGEIKNSHLGPGAKMGHFSYLGDATVGAGANIGAGTITCNYDGQRKHRTIIGQGAFIGSDSMLVAPVEIGDGAKTGAGSVVTRDVPPGSVAYGVPARVKFEPGTDDSEVE